MKDREVVERFQERRDVYLKRAYVAGGLFLAGFAFAVVSHEVFGREFLPLAGMGIMFLGVLAFTWATYAGYRCPRCEEVPMVWMTGSKGVAMNPEICPKCEAPLTMDALNPDPERESEEIRSGLRFLYVFAVVFLLVGIGNLGWNLYLVSKGVVVNARVERVIRKNRGSDFRVVWQDPITDTRRRGTVDSMNGARKGETGRIILLDGKAYGVDWFERWVFTVATFGMGVYAFFMARKERRKLDDGD